MSDTTVSVVATLAIFAMLGTAAAAQGISANFDAAYVSKYVWRGIPQTAGGAFQPSVTFAGSNGFSFSLWASQDSHRNAVTENDYTLNYAWNADEIVMSAGFVYYAFPNTTYASTSEVYATARFGGLLSPTLSINYDVDDAAGFYASLGGSYSRPLAKTSLNLSGKLSLSSSGYNDYWFGVASTGLSDLCLSASVPLSAGRVTLTPYVSYSMLISRKLRRSPNMQGLESSNFVVGLAASRAF